MKAFHRLGRLGVAVVGSRQLSAPRTVFVAHTASRTDSQPQYHIAGTDDHRRQLITAADLPSPIGGGKVIEYHRNARSLDQLSICQPQPLATLGAPRSRVAVFRLAIRPVTDPSHLPRWTNSRIAMPWRCNLPTGALPSTPSRSIRAGSPIALQAGTRRRHPGAASELRLDPGRRRACRS